MDNISTVGSTQSPSTLQELHAALGEVHDTISVLEKRLQPVINNVPSELSIADKAVKEFSGHLSDAVHGAYSASSRIRNIVDRLAV